MGTGGKGGGGGTSAKGGAGGGAKGGSGGSVGPDGGAGNGTGGSAGSGTGGSGTGGTGTGGTGTGGRAPAARAPAARAPAARAPAARAPAVGTGGTGTGGTGTGGTGTGGTGTGGTGTGGTGTGGTGTGGTGTGGTGTGGTGGGPQTFTVGGTVSGLVGTGLSLADGLGHQLDVTADGAFMFAMKVPGGSDVAVTVGQQPTAPTQVCTVSGGSITGIAQDTNTVVVTCVTNRYHVGGTVSGLAGTGLTLQDNGGDDLPITRGRRLHVSDDGRERRDLHRIDQDPADGPGPDLPALERVGHHRDQRRHGRRGQLRDQLVHRRWDRQRPRRHRPGPAEQRRQ